MSLFFSILWASRHFSALSTWTFLINLQKVAKNGIYLTPYICSERISDRQPFMNNKIFLKKALIEVDRSFGTFCVQIGQVFKSRWDFIPSKNFEINLIFLKKQRFYRFQRFFKESLWLQKLTNLDAKGAKRSVKMWSTNLYQSFFKKILLLMNGRRSKLRSVHAYGVSYSLQIYSLLI